TFQIIPASSCKVRQFSRRSWLRSSERGNSLSQPHFHECSHTRSGCRVDLLIELSKSLLFAIEIKARCRFGSSASNASGRILADMKKPSDGHADAFLLAADADIYHNLLGDRSGKHGQKVMWKQGQSSPNCSRHWLNYSKASSQLMMYLKVVSTNAPNVSKLTGANEFWP
ncbi:MAG TPA: hypothetical protein PKA41_05655, partial [Verrucomicrobiota bacterium]|nr:hypothetical protein [Verrucomicrobiota bacterium]